MKELLVVVDMQNDFVFGALGTREARAVLPAVKKKGGVYTGYARGRLSFYTGGKAIARFALSAQNEGLGNRRRPLFSRRKDI